VKPLVLTQPLALTERRARIARHLGCRLFQKQDGER
jgi:hypothetical protein